MTMFWGNSHYPKFEGKVNIVFIYYIYIVYDKVRVRWCSGVLVVCGECYNLG